jgi:prepilin-type N-terminal cleavage/methylation domain-containing protein
MKPQLQPVHPRGRFRTQQGMSLVELMVGITIGLFIVAAASLMVGNQLSDNRRLLLETQVQQDLRATMDIMTRQLRRAGAVADDASSSLVAVERPGGLEGVPGYQDVAFVGIAAPAAGAISFSYYLDASQREFGFKLENEAIKTRLSNEGNWQDLTDRNSLVVTKLEFNPRALLNESALIPCPKLCPAGDTSCWPRIQIRTYEVVLEAQARSDAKVRRTLRSMVRVRNDLLQINTGVAGQVCPV